MKQLVIAVLMIVCAGTVVKTEAQTVAQDSVSQVAYLEIINSLNKIYSAAQVGFTATYLHEKFDSIGISRDTVVTQFKISNNKYWIQQTGVEQFQDDNFNVSIYTPDSSIVVNRALPMHRQLLSIDVFDQVFAQQQIQGYTISDSAGLKKISIRFKPGSLFHYYTLCIGSTSKEPVQVSFKMGNPAEVVSAGAAQPSAIPEGSSQGIVPYDIYTINFSAISYSSFSNSIFSSSRAVATQNGSFVAVGAYTAFTVNDLVN